ncbi:unnamed protein product [Bursaphelenchus okinawaensis]|uniref:Troponin T n=1 Tax=Bursaphelenchus okinawaensis TaxID=465554 RepID=A0A811KMR9_9BILA|nr:unnamed protein product [Bursaphelenchus okinawaensis]CAG9107894.1 unnamed protein product [Bursaphelenchus okinawaensis]
MSDNEEYSEEEYEEEEEEEVEEPAKEPEAEPEPEPEAAAEAEAEPEADAEEPAAAPAAEEEGKKEEVPQLRRAPPKQEEPAPESLTEAEQAMLAAKKRHEEEEAAKLMDYEQRRVLERETTERELRELRERQAERRAEWAKDEAEFAARRRQDDERRRQEEEARKAKIEADRQRREEERNRRANMMAGAFVGGGAVPVDAQAKAGRNFVIVKKEKSAAESADSRPRRPGGKTPEQIAEAKQQYLSIVARPVDVSNLLPNDLKNKIKQLHSKIIRLESEKYDLEKRADRQGYDLKELTEREKQAARKKAISRGLDPEQIEESSNSVIPPKISVASKFDRQTDRSSYGDRRDRYEKPVVKPAPSIAHGTARPPPEWGRKNNDELEALRKNLEPFKYVEHEKVEGARPPVEPRPLQLPSGDFETGEESAPAEESAPVEEPPKTAPKGRAGRV